MSSGLCFTAHWPEVGSTQFSDVDIVAIYDGDLEEKPILRTK